MTARASKLLGALATVTAERRAVTAELAARESRRGPGGVSFEPGTGAGWGPLAHAQARRCATANLENALVDARDALQRAMLALDSLAALPAAPLSDDAAVEAIAVPAATRGAA